MKEVVVMMILYGSLFYGLSGSTHQIPLGDEYLRLHETTKNEKTKTKNSPKYTHKQSKSKTNKKSHDKTDKKPTTTTHLQYLFSPPPQPKIPSSYQPIPPSRQHTAVSTTTTIRISLSAPPRPQARYALVLQRQHRSEGLKCGAVKQAEGIV